MKSLPGELLKQAKHLVKKEPKRPRQASLRRGISSAYYALFHLLTGEASQRFVSGGNRAELRLMLRRTFVHGEMKNAAQSFSKNNLPEPIKIALGTAQTSPELKSVATAFVDLQQARHDADYDLRLRVSKSEALGLIEQTEDAFDAWKQVKGSLEADVFLTCLLLQGRIRK